MFALCPIQLFKLGLKAKLLQAQSDMAKASAARTRFVEAVDHNVRTPLQNLLLNMEDLESTAKRNIRILPEQRASLESTVKDIILSMKDILSQAIDRPQTSQGLIETRMSRRTSDEASRTVLVVDDHHLIRTLLCKNVSRAGHKAVSAEDGETAVELACARAFDLIVLDINLAGQSGIEVARRIKGSCGASARAVLCAVSAHIQLLDEPRLRAAGFDIILKKPIKSNAITACLDYLCDVRGYESPFFDLETFIHETKNLAHEDTTTLVDGLFLEVADILERVNCWAHGEGAKYLADELHSAAGRAAMLGLLKLSECLSELEQAVYEDGRGAALHIASICRSLTPRYREALGIALDVDSHKVVQSAVRRTAVEG